MSFNRPTLTDLINRQITDVESRLSNISAILRRSLINALIRASAAIAHELHGHLDWLSLQIIPDTAEDELLERHASWWGLTRIPGAKATGLIKFHGIEDALVPAGTITQRDDGVQYITNVSGRILNSAVKIDSTAMEEGVLGDSISQTPLTLIVPIVGINTVLVDGTAISGGSDFETDDQLRIRLRTRVQKTPHGGAAHDYIAWAKETLGVTRAWVFENWSGSGTVQVFFVRDDDTTLIPDAGEVATVQAYMDNLRPVTAALTVAAPTEAAQAMTIQISPNTTTVQTAIQNALNDLFKNTAQVEGGSGEGTVLISHIREAVSTAAGEADHVMVTPVANITVLSGEIATLGVITWQAIP